jgi:hypothetical protein
MPEKKKCMEASNRPGRVLHLQCRAISIGLWYGVRAIQIDRC